MVERQLSVPGSARLQWGIVLVALVLRLGFWIYTERTWEDALITLRHAENAAAGRGLTHHPAQGPPIHGFTSPISVLIPLLGEVVVRGSGLTVLRLSSLVATVISLILAWRLAQHPRIALSPAAATLFLGYLALEHHQILFGMAGMETQWIVAITLLGMWAGLEVIEHQPSTALAGSASRWKLGIGLGAVCGLALWGRPDGVILILALAVVIGVWGRWGLVFPVILGGVLCLAPWIVFTEFYYGSTVPHTIVAKSNAYTRTFAEADSLAAWLQQWGTVIISRANNLRLWLSPSFGGMGGGTINILRGARPIQVLTVVLAVCGTLRMLRRGVWTVPVYAWGFAAYLVVMVPIVAGWYLPPWLAVVVLLAASGCDALSTIAGRYRWIGSTLAYGMLLLYAVILPATFQAERGLQTLVESPVRRAAGEWLAENTSPSDWIACECLGYLGYYSNRPMLDFPGLGSPRSVAALKRCPVTERSLQSLITEETPAWLVLRPGELEQLRTRYPEVAARYVIRRHFEAERTPLDRCAAWLGLANSEIFGDRMFVILKRTEPNPHDSHDLPRAMDFQSMGTAD